MAGRRFGRSMDPPSMAKAVTPDDSNDLPEGPADGLYVGGTGDVKVTMVSGDEVVFSSVPVGFLDLLVKRVWSTGTAATDILALYK